jgi:hypothetical protein
MAQRAVITCHFCPKTFPYNYARILTRHLRDQHPLEEEQRQIGLARTGIRLQQAQPQESSSFGGSAEPGQDNDGDMHWQTWDMSATSAGKKTYGDTFSCLIYSLSPQTTTKRIYPALMMLLTTSTLLPLLLRRQTRSWCAWFPSNKSTTCPTPQWIAFFI